MPASTVNRVQVEIVGKDVSGGKVLADLGTQAQQTERRVVSLQGAAVNYRSSISAAGAATSAMAGALGTAGARVGSLASALGGALATGGPWGLLIAGAATAASALVSELINAGDAAKDAADKASDANKSEQRTIKDKTDALDTYISRLRSSGELATGQAIDAAKNEIRAQEGKLDQLKARDYQYFRELSVLRSTAKTEEDRLRIQSMEADREANRAAISQQESLVESQKRRLKEAVNDKAAREEAEQLIGLEQERQDKAKAAADAAEKRRREEEQYAKDVAAAVNEEADAKERMAEQERRLYRENEKAQADALKTLSRKRAEELKASQKDLDASQKAGTQLGTTYISSFFDTLRKAKQGDSEGAIKSFLQGLFSLGGGALGFFFGGPAGAAIGSQVGGGVGSLFHTGGTVKTAHTGRYLRDGSPVFPKEGEAFLDERTTTNLGGAAGVESLIATAGGSVGGHTFHIAAPSVTIMGSADRGTVRAFDEMMKRYIREVPTATARAVSQVIQKQTGLNPVRT